MSYKVKLLVIYILIVISISFIIYKVFYSFNETSVDSISIEHFKDKTLEREEYFHDFFSSYIATVQAIQKNNVLKSYLQNGKDKEDIEEYFLSIKRSLPCLTKVRLLDLEGNEVIRVAGTPISIKKEKAISKIESIKNIENKFNREYIQKFLQLKDTEVGFSKMELDTEEIIKDNPPVLRIGMLVFDKSNNKKGIIVLNICLKTFFELINKTTLYNVHLIENNGLFLNHHDQRYGLLGKQMEYSVLDEFPRHIKNILSEDEYFGGYFFSRAISNFPNGQNIKIILDLKFEDKLEDREEHLHMYIIIGIFLSILFALLVFYFSKIPDNLRAKIEDEKYKNKLTNLPNRLAFLKDLGNKKFSDSIIILISVNNILKIQNTYGHEVSNVLIKQVSEYITKYDSKNITKVYLSSYNTFGLKYTYSSDEYSLRKELSRLITIIENKLFTVNGDGLEFVTEITIGVSDPNKLNNSIEELNEAENALAYAIDKNVNIEIFNTTHKENIRQTKENIHFVRKIKQAILEKKIKLHYQAIYNNYTDKIEKYECLIRIEYEDELIYPDEFLPIVKQINKYNVMSAIVVDQSFEYFHDKEYEFAINLSILDINDAEFRNYLFTKVKEYQVQDRLVIEIVEQEGIDNFTEFLSFIKQIKSLGIKIAIDDFGSGYSNFDYILQMSEYIDYIKIDGSLIKDININSKSKTLVMSLKYLCDNLNMKTIAEHVEDKEILKVLKEIGIDYTQGYLIGKPVEDIYDNII